MPVSGNEEAKVLARLSSDISSGIPLKKRRFLLDPPPSPPHNEPPAALSGISDAKINEESGSHLKFKEEFSLNTKGKEGSSIEEDKKDYGADLRNTEASESNLQTKVGSQLWNSEKEESRSDQGPSYTNFAEKSPGTSDLGNTNLKVKKEIVCPPSVHFSNSGMNASGPTLLEIRPVVDSTSESRPGFLSLTRKTVASEAPKITGVAALVSVKEEMKSKQIVHSSFSGNDQKKLGTKEFLVSGFGYPKFPSNVKDIPVPALSLSLSKEVPILENRIGDASLTRHGEIRPADRSNWDLNTSMDDWEGTAGDTGFQFDVLGSNEKTDTNKGRVTSGSTTAVRPPSAKGKQVISTNMPQSNIPNSCRQLIQQSEDSLRLTLSPSFQDKDYGEVVSALAKNVGDERDVAYLQRKGSSNSQIASGVRVVKSEPSEVNSTPNPTGTLSDSSKLLGVISLKKEPVEKENMQALKLTANSSSNTTVPNCIKPEPSGEACEVMRGSDFTLQQSIVKLGHSQDSGSSSSVLAMPVTPPNPSPSRLPTSSELSMSADISNQSDLSVHTKDRHLGTDVFVQFATKMNPNPSYFGGGDEVLADSEVGNRVAEDKNVDSKIERVKDHLHNMHENREGSVSDEEKINISAELMEESFDSEYESDGNQVSGSRMEKPNRSVRDDEEYEDGEVRESGLVSKIAANEIRVKTEKLVCKINDPQSGSCDNIKKFQPDSKINDLNIHDDSKVSRFAENVGFVPSENLDWLSDKDAPSLNFSLEDKAETTEIVVHEKEPVISDQLNSADNSGNKSSTEGAVKVKSCEGTSSGSRIALTTDEAKGKIKTGVDAVEKTNSSLPVEGSSTDTNAAEDSNHPGNRGRIISLPRASARSPSKTKPVPDKLPSSRNERERYYDLDGEKFYLRGNRDEMDTDGFHRFGRERIQDQSFGSSRVNYSRGRGRFSGRFSTSRSEWYPGRDFAEGNYRDDYRFTKGKHAADISDTKFDCGDYLVPLDVGDLNAGGGRKSLNNHLPSYRHASSRRFSPVGREGHAGRGTEVLRRMPRNISPGSRNNDNGIGSVGRGHDEKFVRVLSDVVDHAYTRHHRMYEGGDSQFIRGNRSFPTLPRGGFPRIRSKSPVVSRTRSPDSWTSPRRRSPDGFNGLPHITRRRSPAMYGVERIRFPDRPCFPEQMAGRRRNSPSYMGRVFSDSRDVDSGRDHGRRPIDSSRRSPSERVFSRSNGRLDDFDPPTRSNDGVNFLGRPVNSARFHEFSSDACGDERRKCGERRGLTRPFGAAQVGDSDNSHIRFHSDDGPRPLRYHHDMDTEFSGRGINQRDFDGRMKNHQMVAPRRIRVEDQEGSYRHTGQVWHDDAFNEGSGFKRRRF